MGKISFLAGAALGYVLGTRAGRGQYEKIRTAGRKAWENPRVQESVQKVEDTVRTQVPVVADKVVDVAKDKGDAAGAKVSQAVHSTTDRVTNKGGNGKPGGMSHDSDTLPEPPKVG